jgi:mono/diheme cytochrome c family protein
MTKTNLKVLLVVCALVILAGCSDRGEDPMAPAGGADPVSFAADVQPIFNSNCIGCHGENGNGGQDLRAASSYANLVGVDASGYVGKRVVAGSPDLSVLFLKMTGAPGAGSVMPPAGSLPTGMTDLVRQWIAEGALEN